MEAEEEGSLEKKTNSRLANHPGATASLLTDDLILEILSRLPARSAHRFKCVSVPWRDLIADPANRNKLPQTLAGFLYTTISNNARRHHFAGVSGDVAAPFDPCLPYLQRSEYKDIAQVDACNGLILCRCYNNKVTPRAEDYFRFVVCNPATGRWVELPLFTLNRRTQQTDITMSQAWLSIRRSPPISTFFVSSRLFRELTSQELTSTRRGQEPGVIGTVGWLRKLPCSS